MHLLFINILTSSMQLISEYLVPIYDDCVKIRAGYHEKKCTAVYHGFQSSTVVCIAFYRKLYIEIIWPFWCSTLNVWGLGNSIIFLPLPKSALKGDLTLPIRT